MNVEQLERLSTQITYWTDKELEAEVYSFLTDLLLSLNVKSNEIAAIRVIEKVKSRFSGNTVENEYSCQM